LNTTTTTSIVSVEQEDFAFCNEEQLSKSYTREWEENSFSKTLHAQHFASFIELFGFLLAT